MMERNIGGMYHIEPTIRISNYAYTGRTYKSSFMRAINIKLKALICWRMPSYITTTSLKLSEAALEEDWLEVDCSIKRVWLKALSRRLDLIIEH